MEWVVSFLNLFSRWGTSTRSFVKSLMHSITGKCELERICEVGKHTFVECQAIEYSLYHSKKDEIRNLLVTDSTKIKDGMQTILRIKRIVPTDGLYFLDSMQKFLRKIFTYNKLFSEVEKLRLSKYDEDDDEHEKLLYKLWNLLKRDDSLDERITSRWGEIGFQGKNPATDFRGMGVLSLHNLIYLMEKNESIGLKIFGMSNHPNFGFSFAIVGINFTGAAYELLKNGKLKGYVYNLEDAEYSLNNFQDFFCDIFLEFSEYWMMREPPNIMSFNAIKDDYMKEVNKRLDCGKW